MNVPHISAAKMVWERAILSVNGTSLQASAHVEKERRSGTEKVRKNDRQLSGVRIGNIGVSPKYAD